MGTMGTKGTIESAVYKCVHETVTHTEVYETSPAILGRIVSLKGEPPST